MAKQKEQVSDSPNESLWQIFFQGFLWPIRLLGRGLRAIWRGLAWFTHKPPLKQIGHAIRWFFGLRAVRFIGRILGFGYIRSSWRELKGVTWPSWRESRRLTVAVIIFSIIFGLLIALVDFFLDKLFKQLFLS